MLGRLPCNFCIFLTLISLIILGLIIRKAETNINIHHSKFRIGRVNKVSYTPQCYIYLIENTIVKKQQNGEILLFAIFIYFELLFISVKAQQNFQPPLLIL